jgi:hypothetical protein
LSDAPEVDMGETGIALAHSAAEVFSRRVGAYPDGIAMEELLAELRMSGLRIDADDPVSVLRSALNSSQAHGVWERLEGGLWRLGDGVSSKVEGLTGRGLADAMYAFVQQRWPSHLFHYEEARVQLEKTGLKVKGTGSTTLGALKGSPDRFEPVPGRRGWWRWK